MSGLGYNLDIKVVRDQATPAVQRFIDGMRSRAGLHESIGRSAVALTRRHLRNLNRHRTADALGATRSNHWEQASDKTTMKSSAEAATITINQVGIGRAAHDVTIYPRGMYLTLPLIAQAYDRRARRVPGLFFVQPQGKDYALLGKRASKGAEVTWWYRLVTSVFQRQDRTLLPPDEAYLAAMEEGAGKYVDYLIATGGIAGGDS